MRKFFTLLFLLVCFASTDAQIKKNAIIAGGNAVYQRNERVEAPELLEQKSFILSLFAGVTNSFSQDTSRIEQYCDVVVSEAPIGNKITIEVDYGKPRNVFADNRIKDEDGKARKFNTVVDALNYMGKQGWKLVTTMPVRYSTGYTEYHYVFRKDINRD